MNQRANVKDCRSVMLLISSYGKPLALVPAESLEQAQERAVELLRGDQGRRMGILTLDASVTLFSPAVVADGETVAYLPTHVGSSRGRHDDRARDASAASGTTH